MATAVEERFDGEVPTELDDLVTLPGRRAQDRQRAALGGVRPARAAGRHARRPARDPAQAHDRDRPGEGRARPQRARPAGGAGRVLAAADPARPARSASPASRGAGVPARRHLPVGGRCSIRAMDIEIRSRRADDLDGFFDVRAQAFGVPESDRERWTELVDAGARCVAAFLGDAGPRRAARDPRLGQWFGGRSVPMGGIATRRRPARAPRRGRGGARCSRRRSSACATRASRSARCIRRRRACTAARAGRSPATRGRTASRPAARAAPGGESEHGRAARPADDWPAVRSLLRPRSRRRVPGLGRPQRLVLGSLARATTARTSAFVYGVDGDDGLAGYVVFTQTADRAAWGYALRGRGVRRARPGVGGDAVAVPRWPLDAGRARRRCNSRPGRRLLLVLPTSRTSSTGRKPLDAPHRRRAGGDRGARASRRTSRPRCTSSVTTGSRRGTTGRGSCGSRAAAASSCPAAPATSQLDDQRLRARCPPAGRQRPRSLGAGRAAPRRPRPTTPRSTPPSPARTPDDDRRLLADRAPTRSGQSSWARLRRARSTARRAVSRPRSAPSSSPAIAESAVSR